MLKLALTAAALVTLAAGVAHADDLAIAKKLIGRQLGEIKAGQVEKLKAGFTDRLKDRITAEKVKKAQGEVGKYTLDDLVQSVQPGKDAIKIKMKNGRTLTTLVKERGEWKADTIWFK
jgi:hypothetical protein